MTPGSIREPHPAEELRRTLVVYRILAALLCCALLATWILRRSDVSPPSPRIETIDVPAEAAKAREALARAAFSDTVRWFYRSDSGSVHMHMLSGRQTCPLHVHRKSRESTLILSGAAEVSHVFGDGPTRTTRRADPGTLVATPPFCGHSWKNTDANDVQANLVFESPAFDGNLYIDDSDPIVRTGAAPVIVDLPSDLTAFVASGEALRRVDVPSSPSALSTLFVRGETSLSMLAGQPLVIYVVAGAASLQVDQDAGSSVQVHPGTRAIARGGGDVMIRATEPTEVILFHP